MSKRRNKNKKAGPVKLIKPDQPASPQIVEQAPDEALDALPASEVHEESHEGHDLLAMEQPQAADESAPADEMSFTAEDLPIPEEVAGTGEPLVAEELSGSEEAPVVDEIPIAEMDMPAQETETDEPAQPVREVEDPSGALAQAIEVDPDTITSKAAQVESIRIIEAHDQTIEMREQGTAGDGDDPIVRPWVPVGASTNASAVSFDMPESDPAADAPVEDSAEKGKKPDRRLKLNKLQKHARSASEPDVIEPEATPDEPEPAPIPKRPREPRIAAFAKLTEYQSLSLAHVPGLPEESDVPGHWRGVGFGLGGRRLVTAFDEVVEIMRMPQITHVPGTQPWMLGVANVRGTLLPVVDLKQFLEGERTVMHEGQRVLVVRQTGGNVAVLIDQLYGQRSFNDSQKTATAIDKESRYGYFIKQVYRVGDNDWGVFSMSMLTRTPEFRQAAA